jgi:hypothetical protein
VRVGAVASGQAKGLRALLAALFYLAAMFSAGGQKKYKIRADGEFAIGTAPLLWYTP